MVLNPNSTSFKALTHLCICEKCLQDYDSCDLFSSFELRPTEPVNEKSRCGPSTIDFVLPQTYCVVAADKSSQNTI